MNMDSLSTEEIIAEAVLDGMVEHREAVDSAETRSLQDELESTAAILAAEFAAADTETMPSGVRERLSAALSSSIAPGAASDSIEPAKSSEASIPFRGADDGRLITEQKRVPWVASAGWFVAAASVMFALTLNRFQSTTQPAVEQTPSLAEQVSQLRADESTVEAAWGAWTPVLPGDVGEPEPGAEDVAGWVVWNQAQQSGYLVLENLAVNDPSVEQYQLWIVDGTQQYPVDGGVFNVANSSQTIVPIDAKIGVTSPAAFGITVEQPGGVVVSKRVRRVVVAAI